MILAQHAPGKITGIDFFPGFIERFNKNAEKLNLQNRVKGIVGSMDDLSFEKDSLDLIWSAGLLCKAALRFQSSIKFEYGHTTANAKSVLSVLGACVKCGDEIELICDGADEQEAMAAITELINSGLGE